MTDEEESLRQAIQDLEEACNEWYNMWPSSDQESSEEASAASATDEEDEEEEEAAETGSGAGGSLRGLSAAISATGASPNFQDANHRKAFMVCRAEGEEKNEELLGRIFEGLGSPGPATPDPSGTRGAAAPHAASGGREAPKLWSGGFGKRVWRKLTAKKKSRSTRKVAPEEENLAWEEDTGSSTSSA